MILCTHVNKPVLLHGQLFRMRLYKEGSCCWYIYMPTFIATIAIMGQAVIGIFIHFKDRLPEAICCCLQTCSVNIVLLVMCCMCIPTFIVTSADISQLWVYLCYILPEASCCCLQTCNVYGARVTLYCICVQMFMVTCANIS